LGIQIEARGFGVLTQQQLFEALASLGRTRVDKVLIVMAAFDAPSQVGAIRRAGVEAGLREMPRWNISKALSDAGTKVRKLPSGWQLTEAGWDHLRTLGLTSRSPIVGGTAKSLRALIDSVADAQRREFLGDALLCFDKGASRPAVVYSWVGATWILQQHIFMHLLDAFNAAGIARYNKTTQSFRSIKTIESFGRLQDADLLQIMEDVGAIGKSLHKQLSDRLDLRNGAGHPNTMVVDEHTCAAHIHFLIENVYKKF
jgi:hypothetical protein